MGVVLSKYNVLQLTFVKVLQQATLKLSETKITYVYNESNLFYDNILSEHFWHFIYNIGTTAAKVLNMSKTTCIIKISIR